MFPDRTWERQVPLDISDFAFGRKLILMPNCVTGYLRDVDSIQIGEKLASLHAVPCQGRYLNAINMHDEKGGMVRILYAL